MGDRRRSLPEHDTPAKIKKDKHLANLRLVARETLGPPPLFARLAGPHTASHLLAETTEEERATHHAVAGSRRRGRGHSEEN